MAGKLPTVHPRWLLQPVHPRLPQPVPHPGALSLWCMSDAARASVQAQLAHASVFANNVSHMPSAESKKRSRALAEIPMSLLQRMKRAARER